MMQAIQNNPMAPMIIAALVGVAVYLALVALLPKRLRKESTKYTRNLLHQLASDTTLDTYAEEEPVSLMSDKAQDDALTKLFFKFPGTASLRPKLLKAGMTGRAGSLLVRCVIFFLIALYALKGFFPVNVLLAIGLTYGYGWWSINRAITRRNNKFLDNFPDALDMIVRSVRSGYPMNSAVRMVADNMQPPVSTEFKQVADEVSYGSTLIDALQRLAERIDEPDVHFFVVVLTVQQDIGGNLSEILNNLAGIIRKRKHLRMKIRAISSEGRTTAWILGSMPFVEAALILLVSPSHLSPLFYTPLGNFVLGLILFMIALGAIIVSRMVSIKV